MITALLVSGAFITNSCSDGSDDPQDPNVPSQVDPNKPVSDPVGTVTMRMRNDNETKLGNMTVSRENNFSCASGMIASIGQVAGLGNITDIPLTGWSDNVAVVIGNGYVYYDGNQYYRLYASQWLMEAGTSDAILGVEVKYQSPFKGVDEDLVPESMTLSFSDEGGTDELKFNNTSVIPFTIESDESWCRVSRWASPDKSESFLYDGISVTVLPNTLMEDTHAKITIKTLYGKRTIINVTRSGQAPSILFSNGETEFSREDVSPKGESSSVTVTTNVEAEDFKAVSDADWIVVDDTSRGEDSRAMRNMVIRYTINPNYTASRREGKITLSSVKGERNSVMTISQLPGEMSTQSESVELSASTSSASVSFTTNVGGEYVIGSSATWCRVVKETQDVSVSGTTRTFSVTLELDPNTSETARKAVVTATANNGTLKAQCEIVQKGVSYESLPKTIYFTRVHENMTINLPIADLKVKSSADWCQVHVNGAKLTVLVDDTEVDRTATITIDNTSAKITVDQSKYAVGDSYDEKGVKGFVCFMKNDIRLVRSDLLGQAEYSTESFSLGATDPDNGMINMAKVKSLSSWKKYYPAFVLCDELNTEGVTGWYLPAQNEQIGLSTSAWSSTEAGETTAFRVNSSSVVSKQNKYIVYAVHQFVK